MSQFREIALAVSADLAGLRLDKALASHPEIGSRSRAARLIEDGLVKFGNKIAKASQKTQAGEIYQIQIPITETNSNLVGYDFPLDIFYEDDDLLVINKPAGLVVHPSAGHAQDTLVNALIFHAKNLSMGFNENRPGIVHRLDKETSGLLVVAKNDFAHTGLAAQFKQRTAQRRYWALVFGRPRPESGTISSHLKRHPTDRKRFASERIREDREPSGKWAVTHYRTLATHPSGVSLVECRLETGRTHQIRVHLSEAQHPLLGDSLYGSQRRLKQIASSKLRAQIAQTSRLGLHAFELGFVHPREQKPLRFFAGWPEDLKSLVSQLGFVEFENDNL